MISSISTKRSRVYRYIDMRFWAQDGVVHVIDERDGRENTVNPEDWKDRAHAMAAEISRCQFPNERIRVTEIVNAMIACATEASAQGSPFDQDAVAYQCRHKTYKKPQSFGIQIPHTRRPSGLLEGRA